jgi:ABC-type multidrug transport system fused ATPase/permease subunit
MMAGVLFVVWQGGDQVANGAWSVGGFVGYLALFIRFVERGFRVPQMVNSIQSGGAAYARLEPLLAPPLAVRGEPPLASFKPGHVAGIQRAEEIRARRRPGAVGARLENVTFAYPGARRPALADLSLDITPGSLVAVTGPVGSGKSALARTLLGVYPIQSGEVRLYGPDGPLLDCHSGAVGYLPQDAHLFSGSIRDNVVMATGHEDSDIGAELARNSFEGAVRLAALDRDPAELPDGLDTQIGELGVRISGGQRQRVGLARAIAAHAPDLPGLLVLDDPFSAIDVETEAQILAALRDAFGPQRPESERVTVLLCSQRLAAFPQADRVVVLQDGRVQEEGTHAGLLARGGLYARIYGAQTRSELAAAERKA